MLNFAFLLRIFDEFLSGFRVKFQRRVTYVAFSIKFAKTNQKFAENSEFCEKNQYYSKLFTSLLTRKPLQSSLGWEFQPSLQRLEEVHGVCALVLCRVLLGRAKV